ncbi:MAG: glycosyltransferase [Caldilineaceae bacterium]|nr:glycosyltransferase [Caldilineaceae bacterium]
MSTVSLIIPAYNQGQYLAAAIQSVFNQSYQDFEIIVVDDGSTDETRAVVAQSREERLHRDRLHYLYQQNQGLSAARNSGIRRATGSYIAFLDADDLLLPDHFLTLTNELAKEPEVGFVAGQALPIDESGNYLSHQASPAEFPAQSCQLLLGNPVAVGTMMLRRSWLEKAEAFDESLRACEDWDMWLRLARLGCPMRWIKVPVFLYRFHLQQMTRNGERMRAATFAVLNKTFEEGAALPAQWLELRDRAYSRAFLGAAAHAYSAAEVELAKSYLSEAVHLDPELGKHNAPELVSRFSRWAEDPRNGDRLRFLEHIYNNLPLELAPLHKRQRQELARVAMRMAFEAYQRGEFERARTAILSSFRYQPRTLWNRGLISILLQSYLNTFTPRWT